MPDSLNKKLTFAGVASIMAYIVGGYFSFLSMTLPGCPDFITAGNVEWAMTILAVGCYAFSCCFSVFDAVAFHGQRTQLDFWRHLLLPWSLASFFSDC
jgi:hypothetical protein